MKKLSIYVHIPFCERKCAYCDFVSFKANSNTIDEYVARLVKEIEQFDSNGYVVDTIFFGGGTPTILSGDNFEKIVNCIKDNFILELTEFTIEGNPISYTQDKIELYKRLGVTRLSVGVQSLNDKVLKSIGRIHNGEQALKCLEMLVGSGLDINCDFMIGLPYQTKEIVSNDLRKVIDSGIKSISCYSLILEEGTPLSNMVEVGELTLPDEDCPVDMYDLVVNTLQKSGLNRYEISNFGKPCLHNIGYWTLKEYVGFGLSAHSFLGNTRYYNTSDIDEYINGVERQIEEVLSEADMQKEYTMLSLRMEQGINIANFIDKFGEKALTNLLAQIDKDKKYYNINDDCIAIKPEYIYISNSLIANLI